MYPSLLWAGAEARTAVCGARSARRTRRRRTSPRSRVSTPGSREFLTRLRGVPRHGRGARRRRGGRDPAAARPAPRTRTSCAPWTSAFVAAETIAADARPPLRTGERHGQPPARVRAWRSSTGSATSSPGQLIAPTGSPSTRRSERCACRVTRAAGMAPSYRGECLAGMTYSDQPPTYSDGIDGGSGGGRPPGWQARHAPLGRGDGPARPLRHRLRHRAAEDAEGPDVGRPAGGRAGGGARPLRSRRRASAATAP